MGTSKKRGVPRVVRPHGEFMIKVLLTVILLTSFTFVPERAVPLYTQFKACQAQLYTTYPQEVDRKKWKLCINTLQKEFK